MRESFKISRTGRKIHSASEFQVVFPDGSIGKAWSPMEHELSEKDEEDGALILARIDWHYRDMLFKQYDELLEKTKAFVAETFCFPDKIKDFNDLQKFQDIIGEQKFGTIQKTLKDMIENCGIEFRFRDMKYKLPRETELRDYNKDKKEW